MKIFATFLAVLFVVSTVDAGTTTIIKKKTTITKRTYSAPHYVTVAPQVVVAPAPVVTVAPPVIYQAAPSGTVVGVVRPLKRSERRAFEKLAALNLVVCP